MAGSRVSGNSARPFRVKSRRIVPRSRRSPADALQAFRRPIHFLQPPLLISPYYHSLGSQTGNSGSQSQEFLTGGGALRLDFTIAPSSSRKYPVTTQGQTGKATSLRCHRLEPLRRESRALQPIPRFGECQPCSPGTPVFAQVTEFVPMHAPRRCSGRYDGNRLARRFSCHGRFRSMASAQLGCHGEPAHPGRQAPAHWLPQSGLAQGRTEAHLATGLVHRCCDEVRAPLENLRKDLGLNSELEPRAVGHPGALGGCSLGTLGQGSRENGPVPSDRAGAWRPCLHARDCFIRPSSDRKSGKPAFLSSLPVDQGWRPGGCAASPQGTFASPAPLVPVGCKGSRPRQSPAGRRGTPAHPWQTALTSAGVMSVSLPDPVQLQPRLALLPRLSRGCGQARLGRSAGARSSR